MQYGAKRFWNNATDSCPPTSSFPGCWVSWLRQSRRSIDGRDRKNVAKPRIRVGYHRKKTINLSGWRCRLATRTTLSRCIGNHDHSIRCLKPALYTMAHYADPSCQHCMERRLGGKEWQKRYARHRDDERQHRRHPDIAHSALPIHGDVYASAG